MAQLAVEVAKLELALTKSSDHMRERSRGTAHSSTGFICLRLDTEDSMEAIYRRSDQDYDSEHKERESGIIMGENRAYNWDIFTFYSTKPDVIVYKTVIVSFILLITSLNDVATTLVLVW